MFLNPLALTGIARTYRHVQRYREIAAVLLKHGFGDIAHQLDLYRYVPGRIIRRRPPDAEARDEITRPVRLRLVFEELGVTFVKLGQFLSTRRDLLPEAYVTELERLQDTVPPFPAEQARILIEKELGRPLSDIFRTFSDEPLASGSIAQVHEAETTDGERVVVKLRRPGIETVVRTDLEIIAQLAGLMERMVPASQLFEPVRTVQYFSGVMRRELDFLSEAAHIDRFRRCFESDSRVYVPRVLHSLTTPAVLVMEFVSGIKVSNAAALERAGMSPETVAQRAAEVMFEQIFTHGFFHADPHPGNILVRPGHVLCFLDYGMVGTVSSRYREQLSNLVLGLVNRDERQITAAAFRLSGYSQYERTEVIEADITDFMEQHLYRPLQEMRIGDILNELVRMLVTHDIRMPPQFFVLTKAITTMEGVVRRLAPGFDVMRTVEPLARRLLRRRWSVRNLASQFLFTAIEFQALVRDLPSDLRELLLLLKRGEVRVQFQHQNLERLIETHDQFSNRLAFAVVLAALIVGSSLMVLSNIPPTWRGIPVIGVIGFAVSGILGFWLLWSMLHHRKM